MSWVDTDIAKARALVIDSNPSTRIGLATMLREYGVEQLQHTASVQDARRMLELRRYDIVVSDMHFPGEPMTGQDLIDDLRLVNLLPLSTVFIMLSPDAVYAKVAEAAEAATDGYLIKPHTQKALRDRLAMARQRKHALKDITDHIEREAFAQAAQLCQQRVEQRSAEWLLAARVGAELWLRVGQPRAALGMFESIHEAKAIPWAKLGIARANHEAGALAKARRTLESLLIEQPGYCDAYDVMGRVLIEQGEYPDALAALRNGAALAPGCIARVQNSGCWPSTMVTARRPRTRCSVRASLAPDRRASICKASHCSPRCTSTAAT
jgi:CheY-like chemotaxis protein